MNNLTKMAAIMAVIVAMLGCMAIMSEDSDAASTIYVGGDGASDDTGDGSSTAPFATFDKAYEEVKSGDAIVLNGDLSASQNITIGKDLNIDLNSKTLNLGSHKLTISRGYSVEITGGGNITSTATKAVTIYGSLEMSGGTVEGGNQAIYASAANLSISGVTVTSSGKQGMYFSNSTVTIDGGSISTTVDGSYGIYPHNGTEVTISNQVSISGAKYGIYSSNATVNMSAGTANGTTADIYAAAGSVTTLSGTAQVDSIEVRNSVFHISINSINSVSGSYFSVGSTFNCTFGGSLNENVAPSNMKSVNSEQSGRWEIVSLDVQTDNNLIEAFIGDVPFRSLSIAFSNVNEGQTVVLNKDCTLDSYKTVDTFKWILDLNGHNITSDVDRPLRFIPPNSDPPIDGSKVNIIGAGKISTTGGTVIEVRAGNNTYTMEFSIADTVELEGTTGKVKIGQGVGLLATEANVALLSGAYFESVHSDGIYAYQAINDALKTSIDATAKLVGNYGKQLNISVKGDWTIDLNGNKIVSDASDDSALDISGDGCHVTVKNGTIESQTEGITIAVGTSITSYDDCAITLDNVKVYANGTDSTFGIVSNGTSTNVNISILNGSNIECSNSMAIYFPSTGKLTIKDSTISGESGVEVRKGNLDISGNTSIKATGTSYSVTPNGSGSTTSGAAIAISPYESAETSVMSVSITGGTFEGAVAFSQADPNETENVFFDFSISDGSFTSTGKDDTGSTHPAIVTDKTDITEGFVTGGTFSSIDQSLISPDSKIEENEDGTWDVQTVYNVTFEVRGTETSVEVISGETVDSSKIPQILPGYNVAWTVDGLHWDPSTPVSADITVIAVLTVKDDILVLSSTSISGYVDGVNDYTYAAKAETDFDTVWSVDNTEIATVSNDGVISFIKAGKTDLTVTVTLGYGDEVSESTSIFVTAVPAVDGVMFEASSEEDWEVYADDLSNALVRIPEDWQNDDTSVSLFLLDSDETTFILPYSVFDEYGWNLTSQNYADYDFITIHLLDGGGYEFPKTEPTSEGLAITVSSTSPFVFLLKEKTGTDDGSDHPSFNPYPGDDDDYVPLPPTIVYEDDGSDSTASIAACAAAAVVAAMLAIVLASTYRRK